jgi:serine/threonine protein kinase
MNQGPPPSLPTDRVRQVVGERYLLEHALGRGGQSVVYKARDLRDGDIVAVKVLNEAVAQDSEWVERMFREARAMTTLQGTAAVRVLDQQWTSDGAMCLVMELLEGRDLEDHLRSFETFGGHIDTRALVELLAPIASTLDAAHSHGIIHRDLKPPNIFVIDPKAGGGVRLLDFGFAKFTRMRQMTSFGTVAGSPTYIAPEGWKGDTSQLDQRVDAYAFGAIVFRGLAGRPPFDAKNLFDLVNAVTKGPRPSIVELRPDLPADLDAWIAQSLAIEPDDRFVRVGGQFAALRGVLGV